MLKRYLVFIGDNYYPNGGWHDFWDSFDNKDVAIEVARHAKEQYSWAHVIDTVQYEHENNDRSHAQVWPTS